MRFLFLLLKIYRLMLLEGYHAMRLLLEIYWLMSLPKINWIFLLFIIKHISTPIALPYIVLITLSIHLATQLSISFICILFLLTQFSSQKLWAWWLDNILLFALIQDVLNIQGIPLCILLGRNNKKYNYNVHSPAKRLKPCWHLSFYLIKFKLIIYLDIITQY